MSQIITYRCDRCGNESTTESVLKLETVAIGVKRVKYGSYETGYDLTDHQLREKDMCKKCREELGIYNPKPKPEVAQSYPSLEDIIREIVREEISNR